MSKNMGKIEKLLIATNLLYSLNSISNFATAQIKENPLFVADTIIKEKPHYAQELLDLEKEAGFNVQSSHYQILDSLVNNIGKYVHTGGIGNDSKRTQALNNLESIDLTLKKEGFIYKSNSELLFYESLKTKNFNSFHFLALYLEVASKKNLPIISMEAGEHFFAQYILDSLNYINWETIFGVKQSENLYKKLLKDSKEINILTKDEFLSREYRSIGFYLNKNKQFKKSIGYLSKAIEINSIDPLTYKYLGDSYSALGDYDDALENYSMAINLNESFLEAYNSRAEIFYKTNKLQDALKDYNKAIELNPKNPEFYKNRGDIHFLLYKKNENVWDKKQNSPQAEKDYEKSLELILKK